MEAQTPLQKDPLHHPVEFIEKNNARQLEQQQLQREAIMFGRGFALRTALAHKSIAESANWTCGDRVARIMRDQYDDRHTSIDFADFLGRPQDDPNVQPTLRQRMNKQIFGTDFILKPLV